MAMDKILEHTVASEQEKEDVSDLDRSDQYLARNRPETSDVPTLDP
jgi:hypothetical protein